MGKRFGRLTDEQKERISQLVADRFCKCHGITDPAIKAKVLASMRENADK